MYKTERIDIIKNKNPDFINEFLDYYLIVLNRSSLSVKEINYDLSVFFRYIAITFKLIDNKQDFNAIDISNLNLEIIKKIKPFHLENFIDFLKKKELKSNSICRKVNTIKLFFKYYSEKNKILKQNPAKNLKSPKSYNKLPQYLTYEQCKYLLFKTKFNKENKFALRDYCIIVLFLNLGLRVSELTSIDIKDINYDESKITVIGKGGKERILYLNKISKTAIKEYLKARIRPEEIKCDIKHSENALFLSERNTRISVRTVQYLIEKSFENANFDTKKYSVHTLRHTCATLMYQYGNTDIRVIQTILGHDSLDTTEIYTHINNKLIKNNISQSPIII